MASGRRRASGPGRCEKKHTRSAATYSEKLAVVRHFEWSRDMLLTVKEFHPALDGDAARRKARLYYRWVQLKDVITERAANVKTSRQSRVRRTGAATTLGVDGEREIVTWLCEQRRRGELVTTDQLRSHALEVARARGVPEGVFAGTSTWQKGFLERHRAALQQDDSADADAVAEEAEEEGDGADAELTEDESGSQVAAAAESVDRTPQTKPARRAALHATSPAPASTPASAPAVVSSPAVPIAPVAAEGAPSTAEAAAAIKAPRPLVSVAPAPVVAASSEATAELEEREMRRRRAEIEERKAELLNESLRYDNVLKGIRVAEENALARKRLKDAGVPQDEIDALLPVLR